MATTLALREFAWAVYVDPLLALVFVSYAAASFVPLLVAAVNDILDKTLQEELQVQINRRLAEHFDGYAGFHGVRSRRAGGLTFAAMVVAVPMGLFVSWMVSRAAKGDIVVPWLLMALLIFAVPAVIGAGGWLGSAVAQRVRPVRMSTLTAD